MCLWMCLCHQRGHVWEWRRRALTFYTESNLVRTCDEKGAATSEWFAVNDIIPDDSDLDQ